MMGDRGGRRADHPADLLIIGDDFKAHQWAVHSGLFGCRLAVVAGPTAALKVLLQSAWGRRRIGGVMFRYLNDSPLLQRTIRKAVAEFAVVAITLAMAGRVFWLCHNVDRETRQYYPRITVLRRRLIGWAASTIFVTDPLLLAPAKTLLPPSCANKLRWLCFGAVTSYGEHEPWGNQTEEQVRGAVQHFASRIRAEARRLGKVGLIGICLGRPGSKYLHFDYALALLNAAKSTNFHVGLIVALDVLKVAEREQLSAVEGMRQEQNVLLFERPIGFHEDEMAEFYDFIWRGYSDWSTPITVYGAVSVRKPILSLRCGFLPVLVEEYGLGAVVDPSMDGLKDALEAVERWDAGRSEQFLAERGWKVAAERLCAELLDRTDRTGDARVAIRDHGPPERHTQKKSSAASSIADEASRTDASQVLK